MQYLHSSLQDPFLYVITTALSFLRRLFVYHPEQAHDFLASVCDHTGQPQGPAGALACYLKKVQWKIQPDGCITCPGNIIFSVKYDTPKDIRKFLHRAWDLVVHQNIQHRKGVANSPFDAVLLHRVLHHLSSTEIKVVAKDITGGYQVGAVKAQWSSTTDGTCPYCHQLDTHAHRQLECPKFQHIRDNHPLAISVLTANPYMLHFPLPLQHESVHHLRHLLHQRGTQSSQSHISTSQQTIFLYTDGSADNPTLHEFQRAAWAVIQFDPNCPHLPFRTVAIQQVRGHQTISRAELAAVAWILRECHANTITNQIVITTDSQYVINAIRNITDNLDQPIPQILAHVDLLQEIRACWRPCQFILRKVKSHQPLQSARNQVELNDIQGNDCADTAAVRARKTDSKENQQCFDAIEKWNQCQIRQTRQVLRYLHDLNLEHVQCKEKAKRAEADLHNDDPSQNWGTLHQFRANHQVTTPLILPEPDIHPHIFRACLWGQDYAHLVLRFFLSLKWPNPEGEYDDVTKSGITWHELAIAFILQTGVQFPCWIKPPDKSRARPHHFQDPKVLALPTKLRSLREQADAIRIIIQYLQGFCSTRLHPKFHKTASSSLVQVGWGRTYTGGFPLRPQFINSDDTQKTLQKYATNLGIKPPFHPLGLVPMDLCHVRITVPPMENLDYSQCYHFRKKLREVWNRGGNLDDLVPPVPRN